ncbi:MAG: helix-turn-helix domain-containing protein [Pseudonocardiaceae bacterium]
MYEGLTQQDAAARLNTTQSRLSKLEKGAQALRDVTELRHIASKLGIPPERLGVLPDHSTDARPFASDVSDRPGQVRDSQERWRDIRCQLNAHRAVLGDLAGGPATPLLTDCARGATGHRPNQRRRAGGTAHSGLRLGSLIRRPDHRLSVPAAGSRRPAGHLTMVFHDPDTPGHHPVEGRSFPRRTGLPVVTRAPNQRRRRDPRWANTASCAGTATN